MFTGIWAKKLSLTLLGAAALTLGTANLSHAQTNTFDPAAPGAPVPSSNGLAFDGFNSAIDGAGNAVAAADGSATVSPVPPLTVFEFFGVDLSKPTNSSINFVQIEAFLNGASLYTEVVDITFGSRFFNTAASGLPSTVSSLTFTGFATSPSAVSAFSTSASEPIALFSLASSSSSFTTKGNNGNGQSNGGQHGTNGNNGNGNNGNGLGNNCTGNQGNNKTVGCAKGYYPPKPNTTFYIDNLQAEAVPEPTTMLGLLIASGGLAALKRKHGQKKED